MGKKTRSEVLFVRVTKDEMLQFKAEAERLGFSSVSEWFRVMLRNMLKPVDNVKRVG